jgi:hypothetical protein
MSESDKKKARKKIRKLKEDSGIKVSQKVGTGANAKANPQPPNINKGGLRCYIRYNNMGTPYRICSDEVGKKKPKPPSQITPQISASDFANQHGGYANLSKSQVQEYHRLDMRARRGEEEKAREQGEKFIKQFREERKRQRKKDAKLKGVLNKEKQKVKLAIKKEKQETGFSAPLSLRDKDVLPKTNDILEKAKDSQNAEMRQTTLQGIGVALRNDINKMNKKQLDNFTNSTALNDVKGLLKGKSSIMDFLKENIEKRKKELNKK